VRACTIYYFRYLLHSITKPIFASRYTPSVAIDTPMRLVFSSGPRRSVLFVRLVLVHAEQWRGPLSTRSRDMQAKDGMLGDIISLGLSII